MSFNLKVVSQNLKSDITTPKDGIKMRFFLVFLVSFNVYSATTATLNLKGVVPQILSIEATPEALALTLPLDVTQNNTKIAEIKEKSNSKTGYKVSISSLNNGKLIRQNGTEFVNYSITYDNQSVDLTGTEFASSNLGTSTKTIRMSYVGVQAEEMVEGEYSDSILFTISVN